MTDAVETAAEVATGGATSILSSIGLYIAIGLIVAAFGGGWYVHGVWDKAEQDSSMIATLNAQAEEIDNYQKKLAALQKENSNDEAIMQRQQTEITAAQAQVQQEEETLDKTINPSCVLPDSGLQLDTKTVTSINAKLTALGK